MKAVFATVPENSAEKNAIWKNFTDRAVISIYFFRVRYCAGDTPNICLKLRENANGCS